VKALLDTSLLVAALVESHPLHAKAFAWLQRLRSGEVEGVIAAHSIAELFAVLSSLPVSPRISPSAAWALVEHSVLPFAKAVHLTGAETASVAESLSRRGLAGGIVYDALIAASAQKARADRIVTLNASDFRRLVLSDSPEILEP
jgi:predicted nucleic acid-binding protein